jgi:hypothetical protein
MHCSALFRAIHGELIKGPSKRVRFCVRIAVRFRSSIPHMICIHILPLKPFVNTFQENKDPKLNSKTPLAENRTRNRMAIRTQNRPCRRPVNDHQVLS